jgi:D-serine deaminase-like pyridoxal phosphate-dependent protein
LLDLGFDDILIHAPICTPAEANTLAAKVAEGKHVVPTVDCREHVLMLATAAREAGTTIGVCIDVDVSWQPAAEVRFGRLRSPIGDVSAARDLGTLIGETDGLSVVGVSAWASQIADAARPESRKWWTGPFHGWMNARSNALAADRRVAVVESLKADGHPIRLVNGGSTATLTTTCRDASVTEITVGGAFLCPTRCDNVDLDLKPAVFYAGRICRVPDGEHAVVRGVGGNGVDGTPVFPEGMRLMASEGNRSLQTALTVSGSAPAIGSPVVFRPESVGPLFDRFEEVLLLGETSVTERATTYRGIGIGHL